jgi:hypothetical protein
MPKVVPKIPPGDYDLPSIAGKHDGFILISSLAFVILFVERGIYSVVAEGQRSAFTSALVVGLAAVVVFIGYLASFYLPRRIMREDIQSNWLPHTLNFLFGQYAVSVLFVALASIVATGLFIYLVYPGLLAIAWLIRDGFIYLVLGALIYHGFLTFVRYVGFLYQTGGDDRLKIITFEVAVTIFIVVIGLYQYTVDLAQVLAATAAQGSLALHLTIRDLLLAAMVFIIFAFQISRTGDH